MYSSSLSTSCLSNPYLRDCFFFLGVKRSDDLKKNLSSKDKKQQQFSRYVMPGLGMEPKPQW